jgi:CheY-like chemotaxis protein
VEDDLDDRILLQEAFLDTQIQCKIFIFSDAISALRQLGTSKVEELPTIVVADYNMAVMTGAEFIEALCAHREYETIKKVILSTSSYLFDKEKCFQKGAHAYFVKPSDYPQLIGVAFSILGLVEIKGI